MNRRGDIGALLERFGRGEVAAAARLISVLEDGGDEAERVLDAIFPGTGGAWRIGFTGPPGAGKSSLVHRVTGRMRARGHRIGIIAVDPTSPFTGGALLGDRIRMQSLSADPEVFVRSLASRGSLGGISNCTDETADLLDAFGKDIVLIETVGVGQSELEIAEKAHTVVVVLVPESGDGIQAMKAGLMEIGDVFVMNKADHEQAVGAAAELEETLRLKDVPDGAWVPRVVLASAREDTGIEDLVAVMVEHRRHLEERGLMEKMRRRILRARVRNAIMDRMERRLRESPSVRAVLERRMEAVYRGEASPYRVVRELEELVTIR
ncbi:MAG: methylmalonyl Co-A mutase-associated GTPase MeaB [Candidatus Krumholzibacteria bacterium]|nr:methylmalonyl Co-A mutase-associated GTPase MeaB [Candidatus Krumholzibacteria bacterium]